MLGDCHCSYHYASITYDQVWTHLLSLIDELHSMICWLYKTKSLGVKAKVYLEICFWKSFFFHRNQACLRSANQLTLGWVEDKSDVCHRALNIGFFSGNTWNSVLITSRAFRRLSQYISFYFISVHSRRLLGL